MIHDSKKTEVKDATAQNTSCVFVSLMFVWFLKGIRTCQNMTKATSFHRTTTKPFLQLTLLNVMFFEHL